MHDTSKVFMRVGGILLAAGRSRRFRGDKQTARFRGMPLLQRAAAALKESGAQPLVAVLRPDAEAHQELLIRLGFPFVINEDAAQGMSSTIKVGLQYISAKSIGAVLITTCDQPLVTHVQLKTMIDQWHVDMPLALAAAYSDTIGVPAIISIELFPQLMALEGDRGAGPLLRCISGVATFSLPEAGFDIDSSDQIGAR
jgi:molybdenum cofactor cytidylyltransferase